jgi:hypothetical protein
MLDKSIFATAKKSSGKAGLSRPLSRAPGRIT